jgi:LL-diaminopimelate aminotransferase
MRPAARMAHLKPHFFASLNARINELAAQGREVVRLDEGAPDMPPAPHIIQALINAAQQPDTHGYQAHIGPKKLRQAWADWYKNLFSVELDPDTEIIPLLGSKEGIFHLSLAYLEPGDVALVPDPGYITYRRGAFISGAEVEFFPLIRERGYLPDLEAIPVHKLEKAKLLWLNYPNNPTGATATLEFFEKVIALAHSHGFIVCHDAAYIQVAFEGESPPSLLQVPGAREVAIEFNSLSKSHNMAGWRTGALLGNAQAVKTLFTLKTNADSGHFLPILEASVAALTGDQSWLVERNEIYRRRRDAVLAGLNSAGMQAEKPHASLYVWSTVPSGWECEEFAIAALENAGVSMTPGTVFGQRGEGYIRIALTVPEAQIASAMRRLNEWLTTTRKG